MLLSAHISVPGEPFRSAMLCQKSFWSGNVEIYAYLISTEHGRSADQKRTNILFMMQKTALQQSGEFKTCNTGLQNLQTFSTLLLNNLNSTWTSKKKHQSPQTRKQKGYPQTILIINFLKRAKIYAPSHWMQYRCISQKHISLWSN